MWKLVIEDDEAKRTSVPLTRDDYTIGRKEGNTIRLTERNVSREHAKIHKAPNGVSTHSPDSPFVLEDMNSYNGVYVNGLRVAQPQKLQHGDLIQIGDYRIILQDEALTDDVNGSATTQDMKSTVPTGHVSRASLLLERPNRLVMLAGPTPGAEFPLDDTRTTIGRAEDCTISVNHNSVSRLHCEVHALGGEGRYEVVDKGSSNGVRVNGSDLRRSIVEPGDIIELGDVRFRFVGAGQIFLPGVGDSQQLETIADRPPSTLRPQQSSSTSLVPFVVVGALVAVAVVVGFAVVQHQQQQQQPVGDATQHPSDDPEQIALQAAKKLCDEGNCDLAHDKLFTQIGAKSPLRNTSDFQNIEVRWADKVLAAAEAEADPNKKRVLLRSITADDGVPVERRNVAKAKLDELEAATSVPTVTASQPPPTPTHTATVPTHTATTATAAPTHTVRHSTGGANVLTQAQALALAGDNAGARALLEPRVFGGKASAEEVRMLKGVCKAQHDKACLGAIDKKYP